MRWVLASLVLVVVAACGSKKSPPPSCTEIVDKMMGLMKADLGGELGDKKGMVAQCEKSFDDDMKRCLGDAADLNAVAVCRGGKAKPRRPVPKPDNKPAPVDPHKDLKP